MIGKVRALESNFSSLPAFYGSGFVLFHVFVANFRSHVVVCTEIASKRRHLKVQKGARERNAEGESCLWTLDPLDLDLKLVASAKTIFL